MKYTPEGEGDNLPVGRAARALARCLVASIVASMLAAGCDHAFEPFQEVDAGFSMFGNLDLYADTQWIRVMPIRQNVRIGPEPLDAVVTLEHLESRQIITLKDSVFSFPDPQLGSVAYAHNFWTTQPLDPRAPYRLTAKRSDGATTTATIVMPEELQVTFRTELPLGGQVRVHSEKVLFVDVLYLKRDLCGGGGAVEFAINQPLLAGGFYVVRADQQPPECYAYNRPEIRVSTAPVDWPYHAEISDVEAAVPGRVTSNVENGVGFVGGVATWRIPFHICSVVAPRPGRPRPCEIVYTRDLVTISGRVIRQPCGAPHGLAPVQIREEFPSGGVVTRSWSTNLNGEYRFEGIEPGARITLELAPGTPAFRVPVLGPGERYRVEDLVAPVPC